MYLRKACKQVLEYRRGTRFELGKIEAGWASVRSPCEIRFVAHVKVQEVTGSFPPSHGPEFRSRLLPGSFPFLGFFFSRFCLSFLMSEVCHDFSMVKICLRVPGESRINDFGDQSRVDPAASGRLSAVYQNTFRKVRLMRAVPVSGCWPSLRGDTPW